MLVDETAPVRGQVEEEVAPAAHGLVVDLEQVLGRAHLVILTGVVEPPGADGNIHFRGTPVRAVAMARVEHLEIGLAGEHPLRADGGPAGIAREPGLVTDPADIRAGVAEDHRLGLQLAHDAPGGLPVVVGLLVNPAVLARVPVIAFAAVGAIKP